MSLLKANTIKPVTSGADLSLQGDSGGSAVDCLNITSAGDINFTGNTDAKIKLPSAGGIYESDGSTPVLTESGGVVSFGSGIAFPTGHVLRGFYDDFHQASNYAITTTPIAFSGLELTITGTNDTSDLLYVTVTINDVYNDTGTGRAIKGGLRYSTDDWAAGSPGITGTAFGAYAYYAAQANYFTFPSLAYDLVTNLCYTVRFAHPTTATYKIRPYLTSVTGNVYINQDADVSTSTIHAFELKG